MERIGSSRRHASSMVVLLLAAALLVLAYGLSGCSSGEEAEPQSVSDDVVTIEVPGSWTVEETEAGEVAYSDSTGSVFTASSDDGSSFVVLYSAEVLDGTFTADEMSMLVGIGLEYEGEYVVDSDSLSETVKTSGVTIHTMDASYTDDDGGDWEGTMELLYSGETVSVILGFCDADAEMEVDASLDEVEDILDSAEVEDPEEPLFFDEESYEEELADELEDAEDSSGLDMELYTDAVILEGGFTLTLAGDWYIEETVDSSLGLTQYIAYSSDYSQYVFFAPGISIASTGYTSTDEYEETFISGLGSERGACDETTTEDGVLIHLYEYESIGYVEFVYSGDTSAIIFGLCYDGGEEETMAELQDVFGTLTVDDPSEPSIS